MTRDDKTPDSGNPKRILVAGVPGSGKTTVARELGNRLSLPHVELDELFWGPDWAPRSEEEFREGVVAALAGESWTACGNYHGKLHDLTWKRADIIVWLDLPRYVTLARLIRRTLSRILRRQSLWHGNRETLKNVFFSRDSLLVWWWKVQRMEPERSLERLESSPQAAAVRLRSRREVQRWLLSVGASELTLGLGGSEPYQGQCFSS